MSGIPYTADQLEWIKENYWSYPSTQSLTDAFNKRFSANRTKNSIALISTRVYGLRRSNRQEFTLEEDTWLVENYPKYRSDILREKFMEKFDHPTSARNLITHCNKTLGIVSGRQSFEKGGNPDNLLSVGSERKTKQGYILVKVDDCKGEHGNSKAYHQNWKHKQILVWERHYGKIPPKHCIIFLDGDNSNCDIRNLYCVPTKVNAILARDKWFTDDPELNLAAIKWAELYYVLKEIKGE